MISISDFQLQYVEPLLNGLRYPFPFSCNEEDGFFITKFYPDFNYFGKLGLHPEGAIYADSSSGTGVSVLLVLYVQNSVCSDQSGWCVISGSFDDQKQIWSNWKVSIDEFDEYTEPQNPTAFSQPFPITKTTSDITQLLSESFCCTFEQNETDLSWKAQLMPLIGLEAVVSRKSQSQMNFYVEMNLNGNKILFGSEKYTCLKYKISDSNELLFIGFE